MSKRDLNKLSQEEKEADAAIHRFAAEHGVLKCVGYRKSVFTYLDMSIATGKFRLASEPNAPFDKTATDVKIKYSTSSNKASVSIRVVTHLREDNLFSKPAFEHHWTLEEWFRTYREEWQALQVKWPRPCPEKIRRERRKEQKQDRDQKQDQDSKRLKTCSEEIDRLVAKLECLEITNRELHTSNEAIQTELEELRSQKGIVEKVKNQLVKKEEELIDRERHLAYWWKEKTEYERQQTETARLKDIERRQEERLERHNANEVQKDAERNAYAQMKTREDVRLTSIYRGLSWREVLIGLNMYESHDEARAQAKKRILRLLHPDGSHTRHKSMEERATAEAQFVFLNSIM